MNREWIEESIEGTNLTFEEIDLGVKCGHFVLFEAEEACCVGEFVVSPREQAFNVFVGGGSLEGLAKLVPIVIDYAKERGCSLVGCTGRIGWQRFFEQFGFTTEFCVQKAI